MLSPALARSPLLRRPPSASALRLKLSATRRFESTASTATTKAAETAKETASKVASTASNYSARATQGLSRVTSAAGPALRGVASALGRVGGRTGRLIAFVERQVPFVVYYSRVGLEVAKLVFQGQKMTPPPLATFQSYFQGLWKSARNPNALLQTAQTAAAQPASILQRARNVSRAQLVAGGVILAECIGFFTVGEMAGRLKLVGYHGEAGGAHH